MSKMDEKILAVNRSYLFNDERLEFQGVTKDVELTKEINRRLGNYMVVRRGDAEEDVSLKQPIPYVVVKRGDSVFLYKRLEGGGEEKLHNQLSIGVGGHMNKFNDILNWKDNLKFNMFRELNEELHMVSAGHNEPEVIGLINDDYDPTGAGVYHIGVLAILDLPEDAEVEVKETDTLEGYWVRIKDLKKAPLFEGLESWSQFAAEVL